MIEILFKDYAETKYVYHIVTLTDLEKTLKYGIQFSDKKTYENKYQYFHNYIDRYKPDSIPNWVIRSKAIFGSLNFKQGHVWHSHSAILGVRINEDKCWICNENIANFLYEPLILQQIGGFEEASEFLRRNGQSIVLDYWNSSCSFKDNLLGRRDRKAGYDAEVLILHDIPPTDLEVLYIASDHKCMKPKEWKELFIKNELKYSNC